MEVHTTGIRDGKPFQARHLAYFMQRTSRCDISLRTSRCDISLRTSRCDISLRTTPKALLQLVRDRWSIESWHWMRDTQFHEDVHRYRGNGAGSMASLRTAALNLLRLAGFQSIRSGMQAVMHDIKTLLAMARQQPTSGMS